MNSTTPVSIDPVNAIVAVLAAFLSPAIAHVVAAYSIIFISASFGSGWALMRREKSSLWGAIWYILLMTGTATLTTAGVAELLNTYIKLSSSNLLLAPVALIIGGVGHDWPRVLPILFNLITDFFMRNRPRGDDNEHN